MIEALNLSKVFKKGIDNSNEKGKKKTSEEFYAVNHVSFKAYDGEILGLIGPNGAGKTTLLRMMGALMEPMEGSTVIKLGDRKIETIGSSNKYKSHIGYLSGNTKLYTRFSTKELLMYFGSIYGIKTEVLNKRINEIVDILKLEAFVNNRIGNLSTGQMQRVNIARCLIHNPEVYIFDEPTLGLDIIASEAILSFMKKEKANHKTIIYSTHYMEEAQYICDKIAVMNKGSIIAYGSPEELLQMTNTNNLRDTFKELTRE